MKFICIEEKEYYTTTIDGSSVVIVCDVEADMFGEAEVRDIQFKKPKLIIYPDTNSWMELEVKDWSELKKYIPEPLIKKIESRAADDVAEKFWEELDEDQAEGQRSRSSCE